MREVAPILLRAWLGIGLMFGVYLLLGQTDISGQQGYIFGVGLVSGMMLFFDWLHRRRA